MTVRTVHIEFIFAYITVVSLLNSSWDYVFVWRLSNCLHSLQTLERAQFLNHWHMKG